MYRQESSGTARLRLSGRVSSRDARRLKRDVAACEAPRILVDLADVTELDVVALGSILDVDASCSAAGGRLEVVPPRGRARDMLMLVGGSGRLHFVEDAREPGAGEPAVAPA